MGVEVGVKLQHHQDLPDLLLPPGQALAGQLKGPTKGANYKKALAITVGLKTYYNNVTCWLWKQTDASAFWFTAFDSPKASPKVERHFGLADSARKLKFALTC